MNRQSSPLRLDAVTSLAQDGWDHPSAAIIEQLPVAAYACDAAGRILWFNTLASDLWGRAPRIGDNNELYCGSHRLFFDGRLIDRDRTPMAEVLRTGVPIRGVEGRVERPDGTDIWAVVHIVPVHSDGGDVVGAINCFHERVGGHSFDTPDARPNEWVMARDARLAATYEHVGVGIVEVDRDGRMLRVNQRLCDLMGCPATELLGKTIFDETMPEDVGPDHERFRAQVAGTLDRYTVEKRIRRNGGEHFWAEVTSSSVRDSAGRFLYAVRVQYDISARKKAEQDLARRMNEQAALFEFSERLQRVSRREDIYDAALDAIIRGLGCSRASVLLYEGGPAMRFVAWRGLSEGYRRAVEGHSPWTRDERNPMPVCFEDVAASELSEELKAIVANEGIHAVAFIPIMHDGALSGKFMAYYDAPHAFSEQELEVALTLARQLGFGLSREEAERLRTASERDLLRLASIVESSDDAIISKDLNGIIQTWNLGAERLFGYTAEEAIGRSVTMLIPDDRPDEEPHILSRIRAGEHIHQYETVRKHKDGTLRDISLSVSPMRNAAGQIIGASKIGRNIGERIAADRKLRASEQRLQELLEAVPAAIYTTDATGRITYFNQAAVDLAGRTPLIGSDEWCVTWKLYYPDGTPLPHDQCPMAVALKEGRPIRNAEAIAERPDGTRVPFIPFPTPLRDAHGNVVGAINMLVDISERRQAETQQRLLLNELNHRTKNNMQMLQSLLMMAAKNTASEEARRVLDEAGRRIAAMAAAQRVLYATPNAGHFEAREFLNAVCETVRQTLPPGAELACRSIHASMPTDIAMPLSLIINELITNALKYGAKNGAAKIVVSLARHDDHFSVCVEDGGEGFDLPTVRKTSSGLQLVLGLARQIQGTITNARHPSRVCLNLPSDAVS
jgi:PAS domain S-box-containing protein